MYERLCVRGQGRGMGLLQVAGGMGWREPEWGWKREEEREGGNGTLASAVTGREEGGEGQDDF